MPKKLHQKCTDPVSTHFYGRFSNSIHPILYIPYIPASVTTLSCFDYDGLNGSKELAFNCYLEEVYIAGTPKLTGNPFAYSENIKRFSGPLATAGGRALVKGTTLYSYAFGSPEAEFTIPSTVKTIGLAAFYHASGGSLMCSPLALLTRMSLFNLQPARTPMVGISISIQENWY